MTGRPPFVPTDQQRQTVLVGRANGGAVSLIARNLSISKRRCADTSWPSVYAWNDQRPRQPLTRIRKERLDERQDHAAARESIACDS